VRKSGPLVFLVQSLGEDHLIIILRIETRSWSPGSTFHWDTYGPISLNAKGFQQRGLFKPRSHVTGGYLLEHRVGLLMDRAYEQLPTFEHDHDPMRSTGRPTMRTAAIPAIRTEVSISNSVNRRPSMAKRIRLILAPCYNYFLIIAHDNT
jgi:hypothetical protein